MKPWPTSKKKRLWSQKASFSIPLLWGVTIWVILPLTPAPLRAALGTATWPHVLVSLSMVPSCSFFPNTTSGPIPKGNLRMEEVMKRKGHGSHTQSWKGCGLIEKCTKNWHSEYPLCGVPWIIPKSSTLPLSCLVSEWYNAHSESRKLGIISLC